MPKITCLIDSSDAIELDFVEREATPKEVMKYAVEVHLSGFIII